MNWIQEVEKRIKRQNRILFAKDSLYLQDLRDLLGTQNHRVLVLWALDLAEESVQAWNQKHPDELPDDFSGMEDFFNYYFNNR